MDKLKLGDLLDEYAHVYPKSESARYRARRKYEKLIRAAILEEAVKRVCSECQMRDICKREECSVLRRIRGKEEK